MRTPGLMDEPDPHQSWQVDQIIVGNDEILVDSLQHPAWVESAGLPGRYSDLDGIPSTPSPLEVPQHCPTSKVLVPSADQLTSSSTSCVTSTDGGYKPHSAVGINSIYALDPAKILQQEPEQCAPTVPQMCSVLTPHYTKHFGEMMDPATPSTRMHISSSRLRQKDLNCPEADCTFTCNTQSDLKKHIARHERRFICSLPNCPRRGKGFPTRNDLERHKTSVHGNGWFYGRPQYKCFSLHCKTGDKEWPRFDNFKQHLRRMHSDESEEDLIRRSKEWYNSEKQRVQPTLISNWDTRSWGSHSQTSLQHQPSNFQSQLNQSPHEELMVKQRLRERPTPALSLPNPDIGTLSEALESNLHPPEPAPSDFAQIGAANQCELDLSEHDLLLAASSDGPPTAQRPFSLLKSVIELVEQSANVPNSKNSIVASGLSECVNLATFNSLQRPTTSTATTEPSAPSLSFSTQTSHPEKSEIIRTYPCSESGCQKSFVRKGDRKKHLERHHRPYGCTFPTCHDRFGSKYDWKRHENLIHFQQECWRCDLCRGDKKQQRQYIPTRLFYKRQVYVDHLENAHSASSTMVREHLRTRRIGRNCLGSFWCGFCKSIVTAQGKGLEGARERFDHIGDHFSKGEKISYWLEMGCDTFKDVAKDDRDDGDDNESDVETMLDEPREVVDNNAATVTAAAATASHTDIASAQKQTWPNNVAATSSSSFSSAAAFPSIDGSRKRPRTSQEEPELGQQPRAAATPYFVICHECGKGNGMLKLYEQCVNCSHIWCSSCNYIDQEGRQC